MPQTVPRRPWTARLDPEARVPFDPFPLDARGGRRYAIIGIVLKDKGVACARCVYGSGSARFVSQFR